MVSREAALARSQCESLRRTSRDWALVASSLQSEDSARGVRDLTHPPSIKNTIRTAGVALAVAPEPFTTVAGVALIAGSFAIHDEAMALKSVPEELGYQVSEAADILGDLAITI